MLQAELAKQEVRLVTISTNLTSLVMQVLAAVLESVRFLITESSQAEYEAFIQPYTRYAQWGVEQPC